MKHGLITLLIIVAIFGVRRIGSVPPISGLLFCAQPAKTRQEAEYIDDSLPRQYNRQWMWLVALLLIFGMFWLAFISD